MEKMGWSKGKGLGRNEQGELEHIKVSHKDNNKGIVLVCLSSSI